MGSVSVTIMVVGIIVWLSLAVKPSSAQTESLGLPHCWEKIMNCITTAQIDGTDPEADYRVCCPVIKPQVANITCFCSIKEYTENIPSDNPSIAVSEMELGVNRILVGCKIDSTYDQSCTSGTSNAVSGDTGIGKNGAIKTASAGLLLPCVLILIWRMIMF